MDPVTAFCRVVEALIQLVIKAMDGQSPEVKKQLWDWYVKDVAWWRKALGIDGEN